MAPVTWRRLRLACASRRTGRRNTAQCGSAGAIRTRLLDTVSGQAQGAAQPASPESGSSTVLHRVCNVIRRTWDKFSKKKSAASNCTQTYPSERRPLLPIQEHSMMQATKRVMLSAQQSSSAQPEMKQGVIESNAVQIAQLQHDLAALQAQLTLSARNEAAARQDALGAGLRLWHDEEKGRAALVREMQSEWETRMVALHAPCSEQSDDGATEDPIPTQGAHNNAVLSRTGGAELVLTESGASRRSPDYASRCLFIDHICHWVASFVRRDWALVCSTTARAVVRVMLQVYDIWSSTAVLIGAFQSSGDRLRMDRRYFGPEDGPLVAAREAVLALRTKAVEATDDNDVAVRWCNRFFVHMQLTAHLYEEMRLRHRQVFNGLRDCAADLDQVLVTLEQTLEKHDARLARAEAEGVADDSSSQS